MLRFSSVESSRETDSKRLSTRHWRLGFLVKLLTPLLLRSVGNVEASLDSNRSQDTVDVTRDVSKREFKRAPLISKRGLTGWLVGEMGKGDAEDVDGFLMRTYFIDSDSSTESLCNLYTDDKTKPMEINVSVRGLCGSLMCFRTFRTEPASIEESLAIKESIIKKGEEFILEKNLRAAVAGLAVSLALRKNSKKTV